MLPEPFYWGFIAGFLATFLCLAGIIYFIVRLDPEPLDKDERDRVSTGWYSKVFNR